MSAGMPVWPLARILWALWSAAWILPNSDRRLSRNCASIERADVLPAGSAALRAGRGDPGVGLGFIDGSVVSLAMPAIRADLGASLADAQWISNAYMLTLSALMLLGGAAGDIFGVRRIFAAGIVVFMVTSLACALAPDAATLIVARALQGHRRGLHGARQPGDHRQSLSRSQRGQGDRHLGGVSALTTALGPFIGGIVLSFGADSVWRLIFAINVPLGLVALGLLWPRCRRTGRREAPARSRGAVIATAGLGALAYGLTSFGLAEARRPGRRPGCRSPSALPVLRLHLLGRRERDADGRLQLFRSQAFSGANLYTFFLFFAFNAVLFFLPMPVISGWGAPEWQASLLICAAVAGDRAVLRASGRIADRFGPRLPLPSGSSSWRCPCRASA